MPEEQPFRRSNMPRPESTIAQNFATDLDAMFGLTPEIENLNKNVEEKQQTVYSGQRELQELEARLREAEKRLARASRTSSPSRPHDAPLPRAPRPANPEGMARVSPLTQKPTYPADRPPTQGRQQATSQDPQSLTAHMPGAMPQDTPTPYNSSSEYVMVDRNAGHSAQRGYG